MKISENSRIVLISILIYNFLGLWQDQRKCSGNEYDNYHGGYCDEVWKCEEILKILWDIWFFKFMYFSQVIFFHKILYLPKEK